MTTLCESATIEAAHIIGRPLDQVRVEYESIGDVPFGTFYTVKVFDAGRWQFVCRAAGENAVLDHLRMMRRRCLV